jgi:hypothetical protein
MVGSSWRAQEAGISHRRRRVDHRRRRPPHPVGSGRFRLLQLNVADLPGSTRPFKEKLSLAREQFEAIRASSLIRRPQWQRSAAIQRQDWPAALETAGVMPPLGRSASSLRSSAWSAPSEIEQRLIELAEHLGLGIVATNECTTPHPAAPAGRAHRHPALTPIHDLGSLRRRTPSST